MLDFQLVRIKLRVLRIIIFYNRQLISIVPKCAHHLPTAVYIKIYNTHNIRFHTLYRPNSTIIIMIREYVSYHASVLFVLLLSLLFIYLNSSHIFDKWIVGTRIIYMAMIIFIIYLRRGHVSAAPVVGSLKLYYII